MDRNRKETFDSLPVLIFKFAWKAAFRILGAVIRFSLSMFFLFLDMVAVIGLRFTEGKKEGKVEVHK